MCEPVVPGQVVGERGGGATVESEPSSRFASGGEQEQRTALRAAKLRLADVDRSAGEEGKRRPRVGELASKEARFERVERGTRRSGDPASVARTGGSDERKAEVEDGRDEPDDGHRDPDRDRECD